MKSKILLMVAALSLGAIGINHSQPQHVEKSSISKVEKLSSFIFTQEAHADEAAAPAAPAPVGVADEIPSWIAPVVMWLQSVPTVGPILVEVLKWLGLVAAVLTALSAFLMALAKATTGIAQLAGFVAFAEKAQKFFDVVLKYTKYLSMFNVQKK